MVSLRSTPPNTRGIGKKLRLSTDNSAYRENGKRWHNLYERRLGSSIRSIEW